MQDAKKMEITHQPDRMDRYLKVNRPGAILVVVSVILLLAAFVIAICYGAINADALIDSIDNADASSLKEGFLDLLKALF